ncbi:class I SAM-dependent methyltransferase family protein [Candidatus Wolfebacteria bacterium]|nr:class I SAM-dependent methyltransferase family protein [Candidatus Wolfebacteria bacterium]
MENAADGIKIYIPGENFYKKLTPSRMAYNFFWFLFIWIFSNKAGEFIFEKSSEHTRYIKKYAKSHKALEAMYCYGGLNLKNKNLREALFSFFWEESFINAHAARNRLKLAKKELKDAFLAVVKKKKTIKVLSLASGSARAVIETMAELKKDMGADVKIDARFVDVSKRALEYSRQLAEQFEVDKNCVWIQSRANDFGNFVYGGWKPDIVEIVGLFDYFSDKDAVHIGRIIYGELVSCGFFIFSNVNHNAEMEFIKHVIGWDMIYKTPYRIVHIAEQSGFDKNKIRLIYEPLEVHGLVVARK